MASYLWLSLGLMGGLTALGGMMLYYRKRALEWRARSQHWFSVAMGEKPMIDPYAAQRVMADLFPRPMGAPSTARDVAQQKAWREHRALRGIDHHARVIFDAENHAGNDGWVAHELLLFCCERGE